MKSQLPSLALRSTRVRLLAATLEDAVEACKAGGVGDSHGSRLNLYDQLHDHGSYLELDYAINRLATAHRRAFRVAYLIQFKHQPLRETDELTLVTAYMPRDICVPPEVSENAGYSEGEAKAWRMPRSEQHRRWARIRA